VAEGARFTASLEEALALLAREAPGHFAATRQQLAGRAAVIRLDDDPPRRVSLAGPPPWVTAGAEGAIEVALSRADLDVLLAGDLSLEEAVEGDRLRLRGRLDDLLAFLDALACWLHGALRCPSFPALHHRYRIQETRSPS
jgi:hypothetical protein